MLDETHLATTKALDKEIKKCTETLAKKSEEHRDAEIPLRLNPVGNSDTRLMGLTENKTDRIGSQSFDEWIIPRELDRRGGIQIKKKVKQAEIEVETILSM